MQNNIRTGYKENNLNDSNPLNSLRSGPYDGKIAGLYDLEDTLGRGHFAVVKLARHVFTGEKVAVKVIDKSKLDEVSKAHLFQEVRCMKLVQHPNVVRLYEVIDTATKLYLVLELGDGGDLYEYILKHNTGLPERIAKEYFRQIVKAISYCHQLHVVHRDLKPENVVFFKKQGVVKLTDFGFSNKFYPGQKLETSCGSLAYSAPEILLGDSYDAPAVDVWSLGVILYMLVCGQPPFQEANDSETLTMIMDCKYDIPNHVSENCRKLISRMLVRNPDKRATLTEITRHPWLTDGKQNCPDMLPLVSKEQLLEEDHNLIVQKMVNGEIATKEEILECLEGNEYNHITATYYLLAERKLRSKRQEQTNKNKRPEQLAVSQTTLTPEKSNNSTIKPCLLSVPRTPGDLPQRSRKCSIVQEDDEEEDISSCSRQENLGPPLNRRGSRSEGRLNLTLQERIVDFERKKLSETGDQKKYTYSNIIKNNNVNNQPSISKNVKSALHISETPRKFLNHNQSYEQKKLKFQKSRTASCSSSDASDDDSEKRKKQAQKLNSSSKSYQIRRDSHDDSSDSQEPGAGTSSSGNKTITSHSITCHSNKTTESDKRKVSSGNTNTGRKNSSNTNLMFGSRQKIVKKRNEKTRLRESQSLNRITEVQEDVVVSSTLINLSDSLTPKIKSIEARILRDFNKRVKKITNKKVLLSDSSVENNKIEKYGLKKNIKEYFHIHKKICIPLPVIFSKSRFYRAHSSYSLPKEKLILYSETLPHTTDTLSKHKDDINQNQNHALTRSIPNKIHLSSTYNEVTEICGAIHIGQSSKCCSFC